MKRRSLQPIDRWEEARWKEWDAIKAFLDQQEAVRGTPVFASWIVATAKKWEHAVSVDEMRRIENPLKASIAYGYWLSARVLDGWVPPHGGPFFWPAPGLGRNGEAELLESKAKQKVELKEQLRAQQKAILRTYKAEMRAAEREAKRAAVRRDTPVGRKRNPKRAHEVA